MTYSTAAAISLLLVAGGCTSHDGEPGASVSGRGGGPVGGRSGGSGGSGGVGADPTWAEWLMPNLQTDVAAGAPNLQSITDNGDGTATDHVTGLMWQQAVAATLYAWSDAVAFCPALVLAGHTDWRLASAIELVSIVDYGRSGPSIDGAYFPSTPAAAFWSSSSGATYAWKVNFTDGSTSTDDVAATYSIRCVR